MHFKVQCRTIPQVLPSGNPVFVSYNKCVLTFKEANIAPVAKKDGAHAMHSTATTRLDYWSINIERDLRVAGIAMPIAIAAVT